MSSSSSTNASAPLNRAERRRALQLDKSYVERLRKQQQAEQTQSSALSVSSSEEKREEKKEFVRATQPSSCSILAIFRNDIFAVIFAYFDGHSVARTARVSLEWNELSCDELVWQSSALMFFPHETVSSMHQRRLRYTPPTYRQMCIARPHIRFDGIYVLETTYYRAGGLGFGESVSKVLETTYFRYLHFTATGHVYYMLTSQMLTFNQPLPHTNKLLHRGQWMLKGERVRIQVDLKYQMLSVICRIESSACAGQCNTLIVEELAGKSVRDSTEIKYGNPVNPFQFWLESVEPRKWTPVLLR